MASERSLISTALWQPFSCTMEVHLPWRVPCPVCVALCCAFIQAFDMVRSGPTEQKQRRQEFVPCVLRECLMCHCLPCLCTLCLHGCRVAQLKANIKGQDVVVMCSQLPEAVVESKLKDLREGHLTTSTDTEQDTTASLDGHTSSVQSDSDDQELHGIEAKLTEDLDNQSVSFSGKLQLLHKRGHLSTSSNSPSRKRIRRISDSSDTSSTAIPEQQNGGMQTVVSESPLKDPTNKTAGDGGTFACVVDSEEEGQRTPEVMEMVQKDNDMDTVASVCEVFET